MKIQEVTANSIVQIMFSELTSTFSLPVEVKTTLCTFNSEFHFTINQLHFK